MSELYSDFELTQDNCDREPIHRPEAIQGTGHILAFDSAQPERILAHSDGLPALLGIGSAAFWQDDVAPLLPEPVVRIRKVLSERSDDVTLEPAQWLADGVSYDVIGARSNGAIIIELEAADDFDVDANAPLRFADALRGANTLDAVYATSARELRQQLGFDRVMVYKFDQDGHGFVVGEARRDDLEPYLGIHYPATDIPEPARAVLRAGRVRSIADIHLANRPIHFRPDRRAGEYLDLTYSQLRATSPIHIEYLSNIGVQATMTAAIEVRGRLWGLIACHHYSARNPNYQVRRTAGIEAMLIALRVQEIEFADAEQAREQSRSAEEAVLKSLRFEDVHQVRVVGDLSPLMDVCTCDGAAAVTPMYEPATVGITFPPDLLRILREFLAERQAADVFATADIRADLPEEFAGIDAIGGLLAVRVSEVSNTYLVWFRCQQRQAITWAGDPRLPQTISYVDEAGAERLGPRQSFAKWQQAVEHRSLAWETDAIEMASRMRFRILQLEAAFTAETVARNNEELRQMSFAASHDLREPLRTQLNYLGLLAEELEDITSDEQKHYLQRAELAVGRMQTLVDDFLTYADLHRRVDWERIDVEELVSEIVTDLNDVIVRSGATVNVGSLPALFGPKTNLRRVFLNLLTNSLKYVAPGVRPVINVSATISEYAVEYRVSDNGIGIKSDDHTRIFEIFSRLHHDDEYKGTGMGLAICKRVVESMTGTIGVQSKLDEGADFYCRFHREQLAP